MANIEIQNNSTVGVVLFSPTYNVETIVFAGAVTYLAGTILARDSVSLKLVLYVKGGSTNENGIPKAVLTQELEATGAGDLKSNVLIGGHVRLNKLVIDADGDASNVDKAVTDELRDYGIESFTSVQLAEFDNQ